MFTARRVWPLVSSLLLLLSCGENPSAPAGEEGPAWPPLPSGVTSSTALTGWSATPGTRGGPSTAASPLLAGPGVVSTGNLSLPRAGASVSLLPSGSVLVAGGGETPSATCEVYDPLSGTWSGTGAMANARANVPALLLPTGKVLVVGGLPSAGATAELYDPGTGTWTAASAPPRPRHGHTLTLLRTGKVLLAGGYDPLLGASVASSFLYDPTTDSWSATGTLPSAQQGHTATLLSSGEVLVTGGTVGTSGTSPVMIYHPVTGLWRQVGALPSRTLHAATLLASGRVLLTSGTSASLYDPSTGSVTASTMNQSRTAHTATLLPSGRVLVVGGLGAPGSSAEVYDPANNTWTNAPALPTVFSSHAAVMLPTGKVLITAGGTVTSLLHDPGAAIWTAAPTPAYARLYSKGTLLPTGKVLLPGGYGSFGGMSGVEIYNPETNTWASAGALSEARYEGTVTLLRSGKVLVIGGVISGGSGTKTVDVFDPATETWTAGPPTLQPHSSPTATVLLDGKVLLAGGVSSGSGNRSELYDPVTNTWSYTPGTMTASRSSHSAVLLPSGKVFVAGGLSTGTTELYDPATGTWSASGPLLTARSAFGLTLLPSGKVLAAGGQGSIVAAELYDPATGTWTATGSTAYPHYNGSTVLLPSGQVLLLGGNSSPSVRAELYDPSLGTWSTTSDMPYPRLGAVALLLPNGRVFVAGGNTATPTGSALFDESLTDTAWRPRLSVSGALSRRALFTATGLRLRGISEGGTMGFQGASANFPVVSLMPLDGSRLLRLPLSGFSDTALTSTLPETPPGDYRLLATVNGLSGGGLIRITSNTAPSAQAGGATTAEDTSVPVTLVASDVDGDALTYTVVSGPAHGTLTGSGTTRTYIPGADYHGPDAFTFRVNDGAADSNVATVSLTVTPVNDTPVALAGSATTGEDTAVAVTLSASDVDGDALAYTVVSGPAHGTLTGSGSTRTYTPAADYHGSDTFTFRVNDGTANSNVATVSLTITPVNDAPVALAGSVTTEEDTAVVMTLSASDVDGDALTYTVVSGPAHGTLTGFGTTRMYTPVGNYHGPDTFTFRVNDGTADSNVATVSLIVTPVNDTPMALTDSVILAEDTAVAVTLSASDVDGDALTYTVVLGPTHGTLTGSGATRTYKPASNYHGPDAFTFRVNDGTAESNVATVSLTVTPVNDAPVALAGAFSTPEDTPGSMTLNALDVDGDALVYTVVSGPTHGTLSNTGALFTYTPAPDYHGRDTFTFQVSDGTVLSPAASVTLTITPVNDAPVARSLSATTRQDESVAVRLEGSDVDGDVLTYEVVGAPTKGTLSGTAPNLRYFPASGFWGEDSFTYRVSDGQRASEPVTVRLTVEQVVRPEPPIAMAVGTLTPLEVGGCATTGAGSPSTWTGLLLLLVWGSWRSRRRTEK